MTLVVFDSHANARLVVISEQACIAVDLFTADDLLAKLDEFILVVWDHHVADGVVTLDVSHGSRVKQKVLTDHLNIAKPVSPV